MNELPNGAQAAGLAKLKEAVTEAIRFWERMRLVYCGVLAAIVAAYFVKNLPGSWAKLDLDFFLGLFLLIVLANTLYTLAYFPDIFVRYSAFAEAWRRGRWVLFAIGTTFAAIVTRFIAMGMFAPPRG